MSLSHPTPQKSSSPASGLSGADALRAYFAPRMIIHMKEAAAVLNLSYSHFFRRLRDGTLNLKVRKNEVGERFVLLEDLILYLFPESASTPTQTKRRPGRPRKSLEGGAR